jgi:hypothetical protein
MSFGQCRKTGHSAHQRYPYHLLEAAIHHYQLLASIAAKPAITDLPPLCGRGLYVSRPFAFRFDARRLEEIIAIPVFHSVSIN